VLKFAPSPPLTYSWPSEPKTSDPTVWLGYCWHQSSISTCSPPTMVLPVGLASNRDNRPLTTQPSDVEPGGEGH
jgi:hypothetical protein